MRLRCPRKRTVSGAANRQPAASSSPLPQGSPPVRRRARVAALSAGSRTAPTAEHGRLQTTRHNMQQPEDQIVVPATRRKQEPQDTHPSATRRKRPTAPSPRYPPNTGPPSATGPRHPQIRTHLSGPATHQIHHCRDAPRNRGFPPHTYQPTTQKAAEPTRIPRPTAYAPTTPGYQSARPTAWSPRAHARTGSARPANAWPAASSA